MWGVVRKLVGDGSTVLLTTQYLEEADALADEVTVIDHGRVIAHDTPLGLKRVIGGQTLAVQPADPDRIEEVKAILAMVAAKEPDEPLRKGVLTVPVRDDTAMTEVVARLGAAGIAVTELSLHLPSLDDVFFTLIGRTAATDEEIAA
jgi:oleandomycin transport system ATP-binding protein